MESSTSAGVKQGKFPCEESEAKPTSGWGAQEH